MCVAGKVTDPTSNAHLQESDDSIAPAWQTQMQQPNRITVAVGQTYSVPRFSSFNHQTVKFRVQFPAVAVLIQNDSPTRGIGTEGDQVVPPRKLYVSYPPVALL